MNKLSVGISFEIDDGIIKLSNDDTYYPAEVTMTIAEFNLLAELIKDHNHESYYDSASCTQAKNAERKS